MKVIRLSGTTGANPFPGVSAGVFRIRIFSGGSVVTDYNGAVPEVAWPDLPNGTYRIVAEQRNVNGNLIGSELDVEIEFDGANPSDTVFFIGGVSIVEV